MIVQPTASVDRSGQPVVAAVHLDSRHLDGVMARAADRCRQTDSVLIAFSVITQRSIGHALVGLHRRLASCPVPVQLIVTRVSPDDLTSSGQAEAIGRDIVAAVDRLQSQALVMGPPPAHRGETPSVWETVTAQLPAGVDLCVGVPASVAIATGVALPEGRALSPAR